MVRVARYRLGRVFKIESWLLVILAVGACGPPGGTADGASEPEDAAELAAIQRAVETSRIG